MAHTIKQFTYELVRPEASEDLPFKASVYLTLTGWFRRRGSDAPIISGQLLTFDEIDRHIQDLKDDLDALGASAKRDLARALDRA